MALSVKRVTLDFSSGLAQSLLRILLPAPPLALTSPFSRKEKETQIIRPYPRPPESDTLEVGPALSVLRGPQGILMSIRVRSILLGNVYRGTAELLKQVRHLFSVGLCSHGRTRRARRL